MRNEKNRVNPIVETDGITPLTSGEAPKSLRCLEIVVVKAEGLKDVHVTHGLRTSPAVFIADKDGNIFYDSGKQKPFDLLGGPNPEWNTYVVFYIDTDEAQQKKLDLVVRVESKSNFSCGGGSKFVGEASIAIEELLKGFGDAVDNKSVTLEVINKKGETHGKLTFMYNFGRTLSPQPADPFPQNADPPQPVDPPLPQPANGNPVTQMCNNGHPVVKAAVGGVVSGLVNFIGGLVIDGLI